MTRRVCEHDRRARPPVGRPWKAEPHHGRRDDSPCVDDARCRARALALDTVGAALSLGFAVRGVLHPGYVHPSRTSTPLASFWARSSAARTCAVSAPLLGSVLLRGRAAPELLAVAGLAQLGDSALGVWQRTPGMALAPAVMGLVHLASASGPRAEDGWGRRPAGLSDR